MRSLIVPAVSAALITSATLAFAAQTSTGAVKAFDLNNHTLTLQDGIVYMLPNNFKEPGLKIGEKVTVTWDMKDGKHMASQVTIQ